MSLFDFIEITREHDRAIIEKLNAQRTLCVPARAQSWEQAVLILRERVQKNFPVLDEYEAITDLSRLNAYIQACIDNGIVSIDTETTGLDVMTDTVVGVGIYTPNAKKVYVPIRHADYTNGSRIENQITPKQIAEALQRLESSNVKIVMHNANFDLRIIYWDLGVKLSCYFDTLLAAYVLNENEPHGLKPLFQKYICPEESSLDFSSLFDGWTAAEVPIELMYPYGAKDAYITYELFKFQSQYLTKGTVENTSQGLERVADLFWNIEMPYLPVIIAMEDNGIAIDNEVVAALSKKYRGLLDEAQAAVYKEIEKYREQINAYKKTALENRLSEPINLSSPAQLAILLYDIICVTPIDPKTPRGTGEKILKQIDLPFCDKLLEYRGILKLLNTYIDKMPECISSRTNKVHCTYNQYGAKCITGDSLVLTETGYQKIKDIVGEDIPDDTFVDIQQTIANKDGEYEQAVAGIKYTNVPTIKIRTKGGVEIEGTPNHPIMCRNVGHKSISDRFFKPIGELKKGDYIEVPFGINKFPTEYVKTNIATVPTKIKPTKKYTLPEYLTEDFAEFLGIYLADGSLSTNNGFRVRISNTNSDVVTRVIELAKKLFNADCYVRDTMSRVDICFGSMQIIELQKYLPRGARNKYIHEDIMKSPKSVLCAFFRGMTLDSSIDKEGQKLLITVYDHNSATFLQSALLNMGIFATQLYSFKDDNGYKRRRISIAGENLKKFVEMIGFVSRNKYPSFPITRVSKAIKCGNSVLLPISRIQQSEGTVYDLNVPNTHSFIANSVINHNTGRLSSENPNLQNIPSHNSDIRKMFTADKDCVLLSADFSQQELRLFALMSNDDILLQAMANGKDIYSMIASVAFGYPYEECLEFRPDGTTNKAGKERRSHAKQIVLGLLYGMQLPSVAKALHITVDEARNIKDRVINAFTTFARFENETLSMAKEKGYVIDAWGRKRRLPDMQLPEFVFENATKAAQQRYTQELRAAKPWQKEKILKRANAEGIRIIDNTGRIALATRQCVNARVQGSAASLTKLAGIEILKNTRLKDLGFKLLLQIHDEYLAMCPLANVEECAKLFSDCMVNAAQSLNMPITCDVCISKCWNGEEIKI